MPAAPRTTLTLPWQEILWGVDRNTPGKQIQELLARSGEMHREMQHQERLNSYWLWQQFTNHKAQAVNSIMYLAVVQNALLMMRFSSGNSRSDYLDKHGHYLEADNPVASLLDTAIFFFGVLQMVSCVIVFCLYALQSGVLSVQERWEQSEGCTFAEVLKRTRKERGFLLKFVLKTPYLQRESNPQSPGHLLAARASLADQEIDTSHLAVGTT